MHVIFGGWSVLLAVIGVASLSGPTYGPVASASAMHAAVAASAVGGESAYEAAQVYEPPVDAIVIDPFRLENGRYGAGNRGLEYGTRTGDVIRSIGDGIVVFAGSVAGARHVTVRHPDGLRSSYSHLGVVSVVAGQSVGIGDRVGTAGSAPFHLGVRDGERYIDPALLFGPEQGPPIPRLIPNRSFGTG